MRVKRSIAIVALLAIGVGAYLLPGRPAAVTRLEAPLATPPGVTLQNTVEQKPAPYKLLNIVKGPFRFGDATGVTAYVTDADTVAGKASCDGDCARDWLPVPVPANAMAFGDWTIVTRSDRARQWAYRGKPLYTSIKDKGWGQLNGDHADGGWHVATPVWGDGTPMPPDIEIKEVGEALGQALVDERGIALYTGPAFGKDTGGCAKPPCAYKFVPYQAPQIALPIGDFTVADRADGVRQWVYKGHPLYSFDGDVRIDDANGANIDPDYNLALVARYFTPDQVVLRLNEKLGGYWTSTDGKPLYVRDILHFIASGAHYARGGDPALPQLGRTVALLGCDVACENTHPPLIAPKDAQSSGFWTLYERPDGRRQWAYAGYALYGSAVEAKPSDLRGIEEFDVLRVQTATLRSAVEPFGHGLYWRIASP